MWPKDVEIKYMVEQSGNSTQQNLEGIAIREVYDTNEPVIVFRWVRGDSCGIFENAGYLDRNDQIIFMTPDCDNVPAIAHLLMHRLGFTHEINHPNRDEFVMIFEDNIAEDERRHFVKYEEDEYPKLYDFDAKSIMHYQYDDFQEDALLPVIIPLIRDISPFDFLRPVWEKRSAPRQVFSYGDLIKLKDAFSKLILPGPVTG
ncbi:tolloid-like protein 2 [Leptotrombidium deliense]|uniref:Metalloendopeptidase n=1 Tax=Leptotrombidium deliense TaxID=299467 RepID=A0A443SP11_9ACAR|nr:tolloid-like protein 2 [Leptotrombidium deliense]